MQCAWENKGGCGRCYITFVKSKNMEIFPCILNLGLLQDPNNQNANVASLEDFLPGNDNSLVVDTI